jgi:MFS transporter, MHS family, proline/betaine transporter
MPPTEFPTGTPAGIRTDIQVDPSTAPEYAADPAIIRRATAAGTVGSFVEWYDYGIYGLLAGTLALVFAPPGDASLGLMLTYVGFLISFLVRPFGSVICGYLGDRIGRRTLLASLVLLISGATAAIGLIPSFATIGWAAPILLVALRILQGFSAGGEVAGAMSFVGEYAPNHRRGFATSFIAIGSFIALLFGSLLSAVLIATLGTGAVNGWAWRILFLIAGPLGLIGWYIRSKLEDSPRFQALREHREVAHNPLRAAFTNKRHLKAIGLTIALPALNGPGYYILFVYMPTYLKSALKFTQVQGLVVTAAGLVAIIIAIPLLARLSDRIGRRPVLIGSAVAMGVLAYPGFLLIQTGNMALACVAAAVLAVCFAGHAAIIHCVLVELFPTNVRYSAYGIGFSLTTVVFGGSAPLVMTWLIGLTKNPSIPAFAVILTAVITLLATLPLRETAGSALQDI